MKATKKEERVERIRQHGLNLLAIFPDATDKDPVSLCKKLRQLECRATRITTSLCNGTTSDKAGDDALAKVEEKLCELLFGSGRVSVPIFINRDPRGYALKIDDAWMREHNAKLACDWGGYGLIAPEIE